METYNIEPMRQTSARIRRLDRKRTAAARSQTLTRKALRAMKRGGLNHV